MRVHFEIPTTLLTPKLQAFVRHHALPISEAYVDELASSECAAIARAVPKRRAEFATGRKCARIASTQLGAPIQELVPGSHRQPIWPEGLTGSITHGRDIAAAIVGRARHITAIGLDVEENAVLPAGTEDLVLTARERRWLETDDTEPYAARLIFSAKEAVYKCIFPLVHRFVDTQEVEIELSSLGRFDARPVEDAALRQIPWRELAGRYTVRGGRIWTLAWLPSA